MSTCDPSAPCEKCRRPEPRKTKGCQVTLKDGRVYGIAGVSASRLKLLRRQKKFATVTGRKGEKVEIDCGKITKITPVYA